MITMEVKKVGGSLMVRIPKAVADEKHIKEGDEVALTIEKVKKDWFGAFPNLSPWNKETDRARSKFEDTL